MPEPTSSTAAAAYTYAAATVAMPAITVLGVPLGLRADVLIVGFLGSVVAMILLNSVPSVGDTLPHLLRTTLRRMLVAFASSITAGYLAPMLLLFASLPEPLLLGVAFLVGGSAQRVLLSVIDRFSAKPVRGAES